MMLLAYISSLVLGLIILVWSADKFVDNASGIAKKLGMPPLLIGMVIIGFGTSAPELLVSAISSYEGNDGVAIGNAYGSNITNIALILGLTAVLVPIRVHSQVLKREIPILIFVTLVSIALTYDFSLSRLDAVLLLVLFSLLMSWTIWNGVRGSKDSFAVEVEEEKPVQASYSFLALGFILLLVSSRVLVFGAVGIATVLGVPDVIIGLTIVAIGTSLPELASSIVAARKGEPDMALGNVLGSNLFNTLAVVGVAGVIHPMTFTKEIIYRDMSVMLVLTISLLVFCFSRKGQGVLNRPKGILLLTSYVAYIGYLLLG